MNETSQRIKIRVRRLFSYFASIVILLLGLGPFHSSLMTANMPSMHGGTQTSHCQSICVVPSTAKRPQYDVDKKETKPEPVEPAYLAFIGVGWVLTAVAIASILIKHLRWRPPDLFKLNVNYQF